MTPLSSSPRPLSSKGRAASRLRPVARQRGAAAVEFAFIALFAFLPLLLAVVEFGRLFYVVNTLQEVTRRAARQQVVSWISQSGAVQRQAVFQPGGGSGAVTLPGGAEVSNSDVRLSFHTSYADAVDGTNPVTGGTPQSNFTNCLKHVEPCIRYVRASLESAGGDPISYAPMVGWFGDLFAVPLPSATVIMPSESLGLP